MRRLASSLAVIAFVLGVGTPASALQVDVLWWDGADQFGPSQIVPIHPFASGQKYRNNPSNPGTGIRASDLKITGYSRTWDVTSASIGDYKQADLFITFTDTGVNGYQLSVRFDTASSNMLNFVAAREYNVAVGTDSSQTENYGLGDVWTCEPYNNCLANVVSGSDLDGNGNPTLALESAGGPGWVYDFAATAATANAGPSTKKNIQFGTVRIGSILFELNATTGTTGVTLGDFASGDFGEHNDSSTGITQGGGAIVIPEPGAASLVAWALLGLGLGRRVQRQRASG